MASGSGPTVAETGHVPNLQTKRVSRCSSGQESSQTWNGTLEVLVGARECRHTSD